jgi:hypothetical protein
MGKKKKNRQQKQQQPVNNNPHNIRPGQQLLSAPAGAPDQSGQLQEEKDKGGRPCDYFTKVEPRLEEVAYWSYLGLTNEEMSLHLNIAESTFYEYLSKFPEFSEAIKENQAASNLEVSQATFKRAVGFEHYTDIEEAWVPRRDRDGFKILDVDGEPAMHFTFVKRKKVYFPPEPSSFKFWLVNRDKKNWELGATTGTNIKIDNKQSQGQQQGQQQAQSQSLKHLSKEELKSKILKLCDIRRITE